MTVTTTESRVVGGTLKLATTDYSEQVTAVAVTATENTSGDPLELLDGTTIDAPVTYADALEFTVVQDFDKPTGIVRWALGARGTVVAFELTTSATGAKGTGNVRVGTIDTGGDVNTRLTADVSWTIVGPVTWADASS